MKKDKNSNAMEELMSSLSSTVDKPVEQTDVVSKRGRKRIYDKGEEKTISLKIDTVYYAKAQAIADKNCIPVKAVINKALYRLIDAYEEKNGVVKVPQRSQKKGDVDDIFDF